MSSSLRTVARINATIYFSHDGSQQSFSIVGNASPAIRISLFLRGKVYWLSGDEQLIGIPCDKAASLLIMARRGRKHLAQGTFAFSQSAAGPLLIPRKVDAGLVIEQREMQRLPGGEVVEEVVPC